jgi:hypothetical protein
MIERIKVRQLGVTHVGHMVTLHRTGFNPDRFLLSQVLVKARDHREPLVTLRAGTGVTYPGQAWEWIEVDDMPDPPTRPRVVTIRDDATGTLVGLSCPNPACAVSAIVEVDQSTRWNRLEVEPDGVVGVIKGQVDHQHYGWACENCGWELDADLDPSALAWS